VEIVCVVWKWRYGIVLRIIFVIILFSLSSMVSLCGKAYADGIVGKFIEVLEKANSSNSPKSKKVKKDSKVKPVSKDSSKGGVVSSDAALDVDGYKDVFRFGMSVDEINKKTSCNLEADLGAGGFVPGGEVFVCRDFSFDKQPAEARFAFVGGVLMGLRITILFDKKKLELLPKKYASKYGAPTFVSPKSDFEAWEKGEPDAEIYFEYSNRAIMLCFTNDESGKYDRISTTYSSEKLVQLLDIEDAREAKEEAAVKLSADFNADPITGSCPLEVYFKNKSSGCTEGYWDFGDGEKGAEPDMTHVYNKPGTYTVKLTVSNKTTKDEAVKVVQVLPEVLCVFFTATPARPLEVVFTDMSIGKLKEWHWDFGDGCESNQQSPSHIYNKPGTYTVSLAVSNTAKQSVEKKEIFVRDAQMYKLEEYLAKEKEIEERIAAAERGMKSRSQPTKEKVIDEWWNAACEELMNTRKYFSEKEIYEVMFIFSGNAINRLDHAYKNKHNDQGWKDKCAALYLTTCEASDVIRYEYEQKSENPEFSKITYYTREYSTGLMR